MGWALAKRHWEAVGKMMETMHLFCEKRVRYADGNMLFQQAIEELEPDADESPHPLWGELLVRAAAVFDLRESLATVDIVRVKDTLERASQQADMDNDPLYLWVCARLVRPVTVENHPLALLKASLGGFRVQNDRYYMGRALRAIALVFAYLGENYAEEFASYSQQLLNLTREIGDETGMASATFQKGCAVFHRYQLDEAENYFLEAGAIWHKTGDWKSVSVVNYYLGAIAFHRGDFDLAKPKLEEAAKLPLN